MAKLSTYALAGALAFALAPVAGYAADLPEPPLLEPTPEPVEFGSAWYLRGDIGYKNYRNPKAEFDNSAYKAAGISSFSGERMKDAAVFGGGVGYKFNNWIRSDITLDYETKAKFRGDLPCIGACGGKSDNRTDISAWTLFWNGYVDLVNFHGFVPYVGGGVGAARLKMHDLRYTDYPVVGNPTSGSYRGDTNWNFAWNVQAGFGFEISPNLVLDANYRFVDLGDAKSANIPAAGGGKVKIKDVQAHEVRVGFRYMLD